VVVGNCCQLLLQQLAFLSPPPLRVSVSPCLPLLTEKYCLYGYVYIGTIVAFGPVSCQLSVVSCWTDALGRYLYLSIAFLIDHCFAVPNQLINKGFQLCFQPQIAQIPIFIKNFLNVGNRQFIGNG